jgi:hypothetical protein
VLLKPRAPAVEIPREMVTLRRTIAFAFAAVLALAWTAAASRHEAQATLPSYVLAQHTKLRLAASVSSCSVSVSVRVTTPLSSNAPFRPVRFSVQGRTGRARAVRHARTISVAQRSGRRLARYVVGALPPGSYRISAVYPGDPARSAAGPVRRLVRVPARCRTRS